MECQRSLIRLQLKNLQDLRIMDVSGTDLAPGNGVRMKKTQTRQTLKTRMLTSHVDQTWATPLWIKMLETRLMLTIIIPATKDFPQLWNPSSSAATVLIMDKGRSVRSFRSINGNVKVIFSDPLVNIDICDLSGPRVATSELSGFIRCEGFTFKKSFKAIIQAEEGEEEQGE